MTSTTLKFFAHFSAVFKIWSYNMALTCIRKPRFGLGILLDFFPNHKDVGTRVKSSPSLVKSMIPGSFGMSFGSTEWSRLIFLMRLAPDGWEVCRRYPEPLGLGGSELSLAWAVVCLWWEREREASITVKGTACYPINVYCEAQNFIGVHWWKKMHHFYTIFKIYQILLELKFIST